MTKKKSILTSLSAICLVAPAAISMLTACGKHEHTFSEGWAHNETYHWHECTNPKCDEKEGLAAHSFDEGVVTREATFLENGIKEYSCECGYKTIEEIEYQTKHVAFEKSTKADKTYTSITITTETIGTHYFDYTVEDFAVNNRYEYYWVVVSKVGGSLESGEIDDCKIYGQDKAIIKDNVETQAIGQFMAVRRSADSNEALAKLGANEKHYFQIAFHKAGTYKIHVTHFGREGDAKFPIKTVFEAGHFTSTKASFYADTFYFQVDVTQAMFDANYGTELDAMFLNGSESTVETVDMKGYDANFNELTNEAYKYTLAVDTGSNAGTYYIEVTFSEAVYGYLYVALC